MNCIKYMMGYIVSKLIASQSYYRSTSYMKKIHGENYRLGGQVYCKNPENIYIGQGTYINGGDLCASTNAKIVIGENCLIAEGFFARTANHNFIQKEELIQKQGHTQKDIVIGNDVWIGHGVKIMAGVTIGNGCVIAAGSVVTHDTEPYCLYAGVPAVKRKERQ